MIIYRTPTKVGTKEVDESAIADGKVLSYNSTTGKVEYISDAGGDMARVVYDTDNDNRVDKAESVDDGTNVSTAAQVKDAVDKKHTQNTDTDLSPAHKDATTGIHGVGAGTVAKIGDIAVDANLSAAAQDAVTKRHTQGTDTALGAVGTKNPPIDADKVLYRDSVAADVLVTSTWTQVKAFLKTYWDTLYEALGAVTTHAGAADPHTGYQKESEKNSANGYLGIDTNGVVSGLPIHDKSQYIIYGAGGQGISLRASATGVVSLASNCYYDGSNWQRIDVSQIACVLNIQPNNGFVIYRASAGANPISSWDLLNDVRVLFSISESTGAGVTAFGANCPAITPTSVHTWVKVKAPDGDDVYIPAWK